MCMRHDGRELLARVSLVSLNTASWAGERSGCDSGQEILGMRMCVAARLGFLGLDLVLARRQ